MYIKYLINSLNVADGIGNSLIYGGNMFDQNYISGVTQEYITISNKEQILDHTKITQDKIHGPFAFVMRPLHLTGFDELELTNENYGVHHLGGYVIGDFTTLELPVWKYNNITLVGDMLACMLYTALNSQLQLATAYLRSAQLIMSINRKEPMSYVEANDLSKIRQISLNIL